MLLRPKTASCENTPPCFLVLSATLLLSLRDLVQDVVDVRPALVRADRVGKADLCSHRSRFSQLLLPPHSLQAQDLQLPAPHTRLLELPLGGADC